MINFLCGMSSSTSSESSPSAASRSRTLLRTAAKPTRDGISALGGFRTSAHDSHLQPSGVSGEDASRPKMVVVAFTFGSFGDFTSLLQLTFAIRRALIEAKGGSEDLRSAIYGIDSFARAIQSVREQLERADSIPVSVQNGIQHALDVCIQGMQRVQTRIDKHKRRIEKTHGARAWRGYWAACLWTIVGGRVEVAALMRQLADQVLVLQTFVGLLHCTSLDSIINRQDAQAANISQILAIVTSISARVQSDIPFTFFDHNGLAVSPMLKMSWGNFVDFWEQHDFPTPVAEIAHNELHQADINILRLRKSTGLIWFELYIYTDPQAFNTPTALFSPVYFYLREGDQPKMSPQLSRIWTSSARWLVKTLENPNSTREPLIGFRNRQQFIFVATGLGEDIEGNLHTRQYYIESAPGGELPEGSPSYVFETLKNCGQLRSRRSKDPDMQGEDVSPESEDRAGRAVWERANRLFAEYEAREAQAALEAEAALVSEDIGGDA